jgi:fructoselysine 6-phosphate deglycase
VALVRTADSPIGAEADVCIAYESTALYALPMAAVTLFALEWARLEGNPAEAEITASLSLLPELIDGSYTRDQARGEALAREYLPSQILYCIGAGPLYGLAYTFALTVFMENIRTHGSVIESAEFRHGPAEMLERQRPDMAFLLGTDESRSLTERSLEVARTRGANTFVFDAADYPGLHPLLAAFVLKVPLQWFVVYSALLRGIDDLDERVLMGRNVLAEGGATWP